MTTAARAAGTLAALVPAPPVWDGVAGLVELEVLPDGGGIEEDVGGGVDSELPVEVVAVLVPGGVPELVLAGGGGEPGVLPLLEPGTDCVPGGGEPGGVEVAGGTPGIDCVPGGGDPGGIEVVGGIPGVVPGGGEAGGVASGVQDDG